MCKASVQEHVGQELIDMKVAGQEKMKTEQRIQVDAAALKHPRCQKRQYVDDKQVLCHGRYIAHRNDFLINDSLFTFCIERLTCNRLMAQNYEKNLVFGIKMGLLELFFNKNVIFFSFLFVF